MTHNIPFSFALRTAEAMPVAPDTPDSAPDADAPQHNLNPRRKHRTGRHTKRRAMPRRNRRGLIGLLLSIVVVVVIIVGIFSLYNQVQTTATATQTAIFVRQLAPQITQRYRGNYTDITAAAMIGAGFIPSSWQSSDTEIEDPEGRVVGIASVAGLDGDTNGSFTITFTGGVSEESCNAVLGALKSDHTFEQATVVAVKPAEDYDTAAKINTECGDANADDFVLQFR